VHLLGSPPGVLDTGFDRIVRGAGRLFEIVANALDTFLEIANRLRGILDELRRLGLQSRCLIAHLPFDLLDLRTMLDDRCLHLFAHGPHRVLGLLTKPLALGLDALLDASHFRFNGLLQRCHVALGRRRGIARLAFQVCCETFGTSPGSLGRFFNLMAQIVQAFLSTPQLLGDSCLGSAALGVETAANRVGILVQRILGCLDPV
jgi:hypothetical protein